MPDRILPPLRRSAADAERFARVVHAGQVDKAEAEITPWRTLSTTPADHPNWSDEIRRQAHHLSRWSLSRLRALWDDYDGTNEPDGWDGEAVWLALNMVGDGGYCAV